MGSFIELLRSIPDVIWSGVIASLITLGGVFLTNASHTRRLRLQLESDAAIKERERIGQIRKEVYLRAAEEMTKALSYLTTFASKDLVTNNASDELKDFYAVSSKLQLVAEPETALLASRMMEHYATLMLKILEQAIPLQEARSDISISDAMLKTSQSHVSRLLVELERFNMSGNRDTNAFNAINSSLRFHQGQTEEHAASNAEAWTRFNTSNVNVLRYIIPQLRRLGEMHIPLTLAIRRDLGLTSNLSVWEAQLREQWERMEQEFAAFLERLEAKIKADVAVP